GDHGLSHYQVFVDLARIISNRQWRKELRVYANIKRVYVMGELLAIFHADKNYIRHAMECALFEAFVFGSDQNQGPIRQLPGNMNHRINIQPTAVQYPYIPDNLSADGFHILG